MRGDLLGGKTGIMEGDTLAFKCQESTTSPKNNRRSRIDRMNRGDISSIIQFKQSFEKDEADGENGILESPKITVRPELPSDPANIVIHIETSTPIRKEAPRSFGETTQKELRESFVTNGKETLPNPDFSNQPSPRPARRTTIDAVPQTNTFEEIGTRRRAYSAPRGAPEMIRKDSSASETSSNNSTPCGSPRLRRRTFDITATPAYKELYANNLRSYGMLLYKDMKKGRRGSDADDHLQSQVKTRRRKKQNTLFSSSRQFRRHTGIPILAEARETQSADEAALSSEDDTKNRNRASNFSRRLTDLGVYTLEKTHKENRPVDKRKTEAEKRKEYRSARINSFDDMVKKVDSFLHQRNKVLSKSTNDLVDIDKNGNSSHSD